MQSGIKAVLVSGIPTNRSYVKYEANARSSLQLEKREGMNSSQQSLLFNVEMTLILQTT